MLYSKMLTLGLNELSDRLSFNGLYHLPLSLVSRGSLKNFEDRNHSSYYTILDQMFHRSIWINNLVNL